MTRFSTLNMVDGRLVETDVREIQQADIKKCPHYLFAAKHYRQDGTCRCNDKTHTEMKAWGYRWSKGQWT